MGVALTGTVGVTNPASSAPLVKKVIITPIQQRIAAVNDDKTLSMALHGDLNRLIGGLGAALNYNADTVQLLVDAFARLGILVARVEAVAASQQQTADAFTAAAAEQALINSYTDPNVSMTALSQPDGTVTVTIANHMRVYADPDKTRVAVDGGTITGLAFDTEYYVYYDDLARAGGAVTYRYSTDNTVAAQTNGRHSLGGIATGDATDTTPIDGGGVSPPGSSRVPPRKQLANDDGQQPSV